MMADPHEDKVLLRMKREAVTTQESVSTTQKQGTDKALLGGLIFLALILVAIIVAVLLVWWFYCRRASRRAKKYRADSDSVYKAYQRKEEKKRIEKQKRENPPIRENIFANFVTSQEHSEEGTSTGMLSVNHLMRVQYREDPEKGTGEKSNKYSRHADYLTEDQDERITARASVHIEAEPKISLNEKASEREKHNGRDIGSKAHQRTDETDGRDRNIPCRSERYVDGAENEEQYAIIEKQQHKPQYLEHSMKGDRYSEDKEVCKNNTGSEIKDLDAKKPSLKSEQTSRNGDYSPEDKKVNKDNTKDEFEDNDFDFHHESRSPPAASTKVPSVHTDDQTAESGTDSESETDSYTCTSDSHPSDYYEDEHDVSVTSLGDHAGVFQKTWAEKGSSLPVDIRNMNYDGNVVFESVDVYRDNGDTTLTMSDSDLDVTSESDDDDGPETKSNGLVNNVKISEIEALNELEKAVQDHSSPVRDPPVAKLPSRDIQMLPPLHQNQKLPPINVDIKNKDTKSRRNNKELDQTELKMRQRHGSGESIEKSGRRRHVSDDFGDGKIRLRERSSSLSRISSEVKRDSSTVRKAKDDLDGALAARRHVNNSLNNSFRDREKRGDSAKKKERPTSGKQRQGHRQTRRQSTGDLLSNGTAEKHESELTEKGHSGDNRLTAEKSRHKQSGHREHRDRSEHHEEGERRHRKPKHRDNDGKTPEDREHSQHRHRPSKEHRSRHGNDAEYLARKQRHEERKRQRMEDPEAAEQYRKQQEARRLRHQRKKEGHDGEKTFSERYKRSKENQRRHRDETEEERRQRHKEKVERHRRHHQANSEKKKKPKEDATDDLALTLHADDELYQMHKLTLPLDNSLNSTGGFSVDKNTKNKDHSKKEHRKKEKDMSSNVDVNQKHPTDVHEEIFNHRQIAVSAPVFADLIMDNESFEV